MGLPRSLIAATFAAVISTQGVQAGTLEDVQARGHLNCGASLGLPGFSFQEQDGRWTGLDVDTCRAVAAAVLGDAEKVAYTPLSAKERFTALQSGEVDLLARNTTWTLLRDAALELNFTGTTFYDGQGFMARKSLGLKSAKDLDGAMICVTLGTTTELNLANYFQFNNMELRTTSFENHADAATAYEQGMCDAMTSDRSALAAFRSAFKDPSAHVILPDVISKEPLGPVVRQGDDKWFDVVKWSVFALIQAEESGVTSENVDTMLSSEIPTIQRLLGVSGEMGRKMGLPNDWSYQIIKQVGNYGEIYERNVGPNTPVGLERGLNAQWRDGGLLYAMPFR
jgi:general L-amino acid transport system substrate-binding protein